MISGDITVARLLDEHPELLEVLVRYHPHFTQLRDRQARQLMAPRVTLAQAAQIAGVPAEDLLAALRRALGEAEPAGSPRPAVPQGDRGTKAPRPAALEGVPDSRLRHVDVRDDIRRGQEPFAKIMGAVKALAPEDVLVLRAPFEPVPLYDMLGTRGFAHWTEGRAADDWSVWFYREGASGAAEGRGTVIDVRGLEPPEPMVRVLEALERLRPGDRLEVLHERRPMFLYPQLDERGFLHETDERQTGVVRIVIRRPDRPA